MGGPYWRRDEHEIQRPYPGRSAGLRESGCQVIPRVVVGGVVADTILEQAEQEADIVALATHGKEGVARLLLGSVADKVIRGSRSAVLVARPR